MTDMVQVFGRRPSQIEREARGRRTETSVVVGAAVIGKDPCMEWLEQCRATTTIKERYGLKLAFDYPVSEKLLDFIGAAER